MNDRLGRDELFYRIGDEEESPELLETISRLEKVDFRDAEGVTYLHIAALNHKPKILLNCCLKKELTQIPKIIEADLL